MSQPLQSHSEPWAWRLAPAAAAVVLGSLVALSNSSPLLVLAIVGVIGYAWFAWRSMRNPLLFVTVFLLTLEVTPPIYLSQLGDKPFYVSFILLPIAFLIVASRLPDMHLTWDPIARGIAIFLGSVAYSIPFAWWLSGISAGLESLLHWLLLSQTALIYLLARGGAHLEESRTERWLYPLLFVAAGLSAGYGIVDFVWPMSLPHPAVDQYIWVASGTIRRAQGVFYESLNFANFCGIFLVAASAALLTRRERYLGLPRWLLTVLIAIFGLAITVSYTRSTWISAVAALLVFSFSSQLITMRRMATVLLVLGVPALILWWFSPELWDYFLNARMGQLTDFFADPNSVTSGRFATWGHVFTIMAENPGYLLFGVGYKTLGFTRLFHGEITVDNGYLSLLLETGMVGLSGFLFLSAAIMKTFFRLARTSSKPVAFWSAVMLSIWCGELLQLMAVDAYTFWRNIMVMTVMMAMTLNQVERVKSRLGRIDSGPRRP